MCGVAFTVSVISLTPPGWQIDDWRTEKSISELYQPECLEDGDEFFGVGSTMNSAGVVDNPGRVNGSLVIELHPYSSLRVATMLFAIIAQELVRHLTRFLADCHTQLTI